MSCITKSCMLLFAAQIGFVRVDAVVATNVEQAIDFTRDVRPILARKCFACHGPDEDAREADLRLDVRSAAIDAGVFDVDDFASSELLVRILSTDPETLMPPPDSGSPLTSAEQKTISQWVKAGAEYRQHWAFRYPQKPPVPEVVDASSQATDIDRFLLRRMQDTDVKPSPPADRYTLVRRLYLDLIGLPPTPAEADAFVNDATDDAYDRLVDALLSSQHYGERWARPWLDLARYSDTNGYEKDRPRSIWPYRDWVIQALNSDMPFDQFTIEQLAGDMLPSPTLQQRIATGFHRNTMLNEEGGIDPLEYRFYAMVDRVATTGTVWMGLTIGCAQCHSHKYDPISHDDYYRLMALLNNADEPDLSIQPAGVEEIASLEQDIADLEAELPDTFPPDDGAGTELERRRRNFRQAFQAWIVSRQPHVASWVTARPISFRSNMPKLERLEDDSLFASGDFTKRDEYTLQLAVPTDVPIAAIRLEVLPDERLPAGGPGRAYYEGRKGDFFLSEMTITADGKQLNFKSASRSYGKIAVGSGDAEAENVFDGLGSTGWSTANREGQRHSLVLNLAEPVMTSKLNVRMLFERHFVAALGRFRFSVATHGDAKALDIDEVTESILTRDQNSWTDSERHHVEMAFVRLASELAETRKPIEMLRQQLKTKTITMVMQERPDDNPRKTYRHHRGEWLDRREEVVGAVPAIMTQLPVSVTANRLSLARWLVSRDNPLAARVVVNRAWRQLMGYGLVRSDGDFGTQADPPTHPELLDWLACEFMERGWSLKQLHCMIVTTQAYRQSSIWTDEHRRTDPINRYFSRGPRFRADAETIRDIMLSASGLLSTKVGGPSVYPPQPQSVTAIAYGNTKWTPSTGAERYRRSLYTFNKRTAPFAAYTTFDGPTGENCIVKRNRSNTPLQSLTLLNDVMYLEFAQALATMADSRAGTVEDRIRYMFRRLLTRPPRDEETRRLIEFYSSQKARCETGEIEAAKIAGSETNNSELAAMVLVARVLLNLDEVITKH